MSENVLILGATSGIARAVASELAARGARLVLAGRNVDELERIAADVSVRHGMPAVVEAFEALDYAAHAGLVERADAAFPGGLDGVVLAYGYMTEQAKTQTDFEAARRTIDVNFTSAVSVLEPLAARLEARRRGWLAVISSVAGDRGRQSNYTYGAAKAGLSAYVQGLRNRLHPAGVHVLTIKPGFVDTAMTQGVVNPGSPLLVQPDRVAREIVDGIERRADVLYTPWFWRGIMKTITAIPESVFKRLRL
jgi:decaprenylphospho-beta-D-erythro-pentofuranosid-2-ulose 2-reductase